MFKYIRDCLYARKSRKQINECVICYNEKKHMPLSCGHPVCVRCLCDWHTHGELICPCCKQTVTIDPLMDQLILQYRTLARVTAAMRT